MKATGVLLVGLLPDVAPTGAIRVNLPSIIEREGRLHKRAACGAVQSESLVAGTDNLFLLRTALVNSTPTESSHTARAAMLGQFSRRRSS